MKYPNFIIQDKSVLKIFLAKILFLTIFLFINEETFKIPFYYYLAFQMIPIVFVNKWNESILIKTVFFALDYIGIFYFFYFGMISYESLICIVSLHVLLVYHFYSANKLILIALLWCLLLFIFLKMVAIKFLLPIIFILFIRKIFEKEASSSLNAINVSQKNFELNNRLLALGEMAAGIAHEINNPLAIISGYAQNIERKASEDDIKEKARGILGAVSRANSIIQNMKLLFGEQGDYKKDKIIVSDVLAMAIDSIKEKIHHFKITFKYKTQENYSILGNQTQFMQILLNLLNNSIDAVAHLEHRWIEVSIEKKDKYVYIYIKDSGEIINNENLQKIFNPFFTTKAVGKGTGLGLSLSKMMAKLNGGDLFYVEENKNTTFCLKLPIS